MLIELLSVAEMAEADRRTIAAGTPGLTLMDRAGVAVADAAARRFPLATPGLVVCGPGNNGGDGFVAARLLAQRGYPMRLILLGPRERLTGDAAESAARFRGEIEPPEVFDGVRAGFIVDALFGAGLDRPIEGAAADLIARINGAGVPVVAVDLPSGINGDTGQVMGVAVRAVETVTFCRRKPGHLLLPGRIQCGRVRVADIGITDETVTAVGPSLYANGPALWGDRFFVPTLIDHKYVRGHAVLVSGPRGRTGAIRMAARAALRAGAGLVTVASPLDALDENAGVLTAVMVRPVAGAAALSDLIADERFRAVGLGPALGTGPEAAALVDAALASGRAVVLDADALTLFSGRAGDLAHRIKAQPARLVVITPHEGEFARLFLGDPLKHGPKLDRARRAAARLGAVVVLKGGDSVIAAPDGRAAITENAPPWLATAGSGDVLAGIATAMLCQGMPAFEAACAATWLHGESGREAGPGLIAEDLPEALPRVTRALYEQLDVDLLTGWRTPPGE
ncbi:NAD(P)H-hydrate dehydratase [Blastochloris viridis]|uniref:Bifunctional NAD(P)H-hydrate repair enzyme n=1 Tax=Blastochloris viridis TaxID=1079 RepID=A0A0H5BNJ8_BLAVI|nr:NAD(P)H-hydrate dehydratase [Blastochloris viridis]ALK08828.1 Bifunctional NAD(P)H-hydrate repair enzyme Nnr [Blastochloris viridis]BAR97873.1 NAD(P)HX epimerase [Blastochloris viridis]CUU41489.1 Nicotinamide nucleotide repair protein [Blastochloris viridis]